MMIGGIQPKTFHIGFKRHFISLKRRMISQSLRSENQGLCIFSTLSKYLLQTCKLALLGPRK
ncbi:hypothetical protein K443DRAFT_292349 [Laccaria amethystina LaAM-08-1]|uniref:Uncharacterized protein n=1 Tax=Laccaria amethystina LaAM-08-1 TaxID=1095629 RepID=A0A0C9WV29_9AGAR|nr:hypothetical protein K443DRAFT_292349 [Laccaria amethystina LaAM-08-1]